MKILLMLLLSSCSGTFDKLSKLGQPPEFSNIEKNAPLEKKISLPMPQATQTSYRLNSLWQPGARAFFKDQRANQVGDILTVLVKFEDKANVSNTTKHNRENSENSVMTGLLGTEKLFKDSGLTGVIGASGKPGHTGAGSVNRSEVIDIKLAALITQNLPNGNLVIHGKQEIRVNNELREIEVSGVVRREDIISNNTISYDKIAEARISYGGRGQITDVQTPRWGYQLIDALSPI